MVMVITWLLIALPIILIIIYLLRWPSAKPRRPPGPPRLPFIGNLLQYTTYNFHIALANLSRKFGPLMYMELMGKPVIVISSAKIAKEALKHNDLAFSNRPSTITSAKLSYHYHDIANSPYSEYWREMRKMVGLRLFTLKQVNSFRPVREDEVSRMVKAISRQADSRQLVNLNEATMSLSSSIICRVAVGKRYDEKRRFDRHLGELQTVSMEIFVGDCFPWLIWIDRLCGKVSRLEKVFDDMDSFYQEVIDEHLSPNRPRFMDGDILDLLIRLKEERSSSVQLDWEHIKGILLDVFVAGSDTSAATITWAMTALIKKPSTLQKAQEEIRSSIGNKGKVDEDDIDKLPYLKAVVKETLRLYPPAPLSLPRETRKPCVVNEYKIEPKAIAFVNLWAIGRDPDYWENLTEFLPERFLYSDIDFIGQDFGFIPFGSGRRQCPGLALGIAQVEMALANILYSFDWELPPGMVQDDVDTDCSQGATMHKKNALCLKARNYIYQL